MSGPYCIDCAFFSDATGGAVCGHALSQKPENLVTGKPESNWRCYAQRHDDDACGAEGRWFARRLSEWEAGRAAVIATDYVAGPAMLGIQTWWLI